MAKQGRITIEIIGDNKLSETLDDTIDEVRKESKLFAKEFDRMQKKLKETANEAEDFGQTTANAFDLLENAAREALGSTIRFLRQFVIESVEAALQQRRANTLLAAEIKATGAAAGFTAQQLQNYAGSLQTITSIADDTIITAQALLTSFLNIRGDIFLDATQAALDLSVAMGRDLQQSILQVGKALNDPVTGMTALQRIGVQFNDVQREQIAQFVEANDVMSAQRIILEELNAEFGGVAETMGQTLGGEWQKLRNEIGDTQELIGEEFIPVLEELTDIFSAVSRAIRNEFTKSLDDSESAIEKTTRNIRGLVRWFSPRLVSATDAAGTALGRWVEASEQAERTRLAENLREIRESADFEAPTREDVRQSPEAKARRRKEEADQKRLNAKIEKLFEDATKEVLKLEEERVKKQEEELRKRLGLDAKIREDPVGKALRDIAQRQEAAQTGQFESLIDLNRRIAESAAAVPEEEALKIQRDMLQRQKNLEEIDKNMLEATRETNTLLANANFGLV